MKLYLITQGLVDGYDTYDSAVVVAESEYEAKRIHPSGFATHIKDGKWMGTYSSGNNAGSEYEFTHDGWVNYSDVEAVSAEYLGETEKEKGVILASFNAG
jgi:hypothetical protein